MKLRLVDSELATAKNALDSKNFGSTSGILIVFNLEGEQRFRSNPKLADLVHYFESVRINGSNAYALNILRVRSASQQQQDAVGRKGPREMGAGMHVDDTLPAW
eukprot:CAMPEP_0202907406 /NCGR_PEP_ID=MMETSP1392-20130828/42372_1 /ASSEMBLY_ACC=CAM_ASM_000868 /TAXON_ID=225041 /ORGANISM="Chlamydomonas chlamydogama, Strain SAG 11-48b" /LENGTH=103 /DNA_ID=CAMNT_0049596271 /DNA_START=252 /DNA_END=560 /DNA_ORIENTATION=+